MEVITNTSTLSVGDFIVLHQQQGTQISKYKYRVVEIISNHNVSLVLHDTGRYYNNVSLINDGVFTKY